ncbi:hypothetical protein [Streptomyces sp. NPDC059134]|uniref:hypothetical protein n=1 Tax=Streptomyces sp. NPDC059134 TaxID=3346738 RepID=UPI00367D4FEA
MPESYPSIGEAVGAAMQHNSGLAHGSEAPGPDKPLQVRHLPHPSSDPYSVPGMIARLTETATPDEVAGIIEEVNGALAGALPQLTELVAAADWTPPRRPPMALRKRIDSVLPVPPHRRLPPSARRRRSPPPTRLRALRRPEPLALDSPDHRPPS